MFLFSTQRLLSIYYVYVYCIPGTQFGQCIFNGAYGKNRDLHRLQRRILPTPQRWQQLSSLEKFKRRSLLQHHLWTNTIM